MLILIQLLKKFPLVFIGHNIENKPNKIIKLNVLEKSTELFNLLLFKILNKFIIILINKNITNKNQLSQFPLITESNNYEDA